MIGPLRPQTDTRPVVEPEPPLLGLLLWDFQPFPSPDPFDPFMVHMPAAVVQHAGDHAVAIAPELSRQLDDVLGQPLFIGQAAGRLTLRGSVLTEGATGPALGYLEGLPHMVDALAAAGRA